MAPFVVGAMTPDVEYLLRLEPLSLVSHSVRGLFVFCLPVGLVTWILWEWLVRPVGRDLVALAPGDATARRGSASAWFLAIIALLVGSASHVGWDAFTHRYAWGPDHFPALLQPAFTLGGTVVPWFNLLQHLSTVVGGVIVLAWLGRELGAGGSREPGAGGSGVRALLAPRRLRAWLALGAVALAVGAWNAPRRGQMVHPRRAPIVLGRLVVGAMAGFAVALVALSAMHRLGRYRLNDQERTRNA